MGALFGCASADSLDMSWLPLPRFESRAVCVAVAASARASEGCGCHTQAISAESRRRGISIGEGRGWARRSGMRVQIASTCPGYHCRGMSREQCVLQCMGERGEGEANGGGDGDGMAVGPMGAELDRG
jgi:hypothetical protein